MEGTCKGCRFWAPQLSLCGKRFVDVPNDVRDFQPNTMRVSIWPGGMGPGQSVYSVFTGPDFGCIHFEPATAAAPQDKWEPLDGVGTIPATPQRELAAIAAIRDGTGLAAHDWESLPLANWMMSIGPNAATAERRRIVEALTKEGI